MSDNVVKSEQASPKKSTAVKKKVDPKPEKIMNERDKQIAKAPDGYKFIFFESGSAYVTVDGRRFTKEKRILLLSNEEADNLLKLSNFRLPNQLELEEYAKEI